jgi:hypothetical protein
MNCSPILIVFVRAPYLGTVKKRLAAGVGAFAARRFYINLASKLITTVSTHTPWQTILSVTPNGSAFQGRHWPPGVKKIPQGCGNLGERMERTLLSFPNQPVAIIGSDIPDISNKHIKNAFAAIGRSDFVFGPSPDGGYWLVGLRMGSLARGLFQNIRWSSEFALTDTLGNTGIRRVELIEELHDIDNVEDLDQWQGQRS